LKPTSNGDAYEIIGAGKVVVLDGCAAVPDNVCPVVVGAVQQGASFTIQVGQLVLWQKAHLTIPKASTPINTSSSSPVPSSEMTECTEVNPPSTTVHERKEETPDRLMNYALQCIQLGVFLMQLNDTEREGDGERCLRNWKMLMLYFRAGPRGTKYAFEAMRLITNVKALYTERIAHRIIHGQFVNSRGGPGHNCANDLRMETLVKNFKGILKGLCGNKTLKAVERGTQAAYGLKTTLDAIDQETGVPTESSKHTQASVHGTVKEMIRILLKKEPFKYTSGRTLASFPNVKKTPLEAVDVIALNKWLTNHKKRLSKDLFSTVSNDESNEDGDTDTENSDSSQPDSDDEDNM
jgi:hypothetical protein